MEISQNFVASSEHMNFNIIMIKFIVFCHAIMIYLKGKVCPNMTCDGVLEIQACRGHGGYPVTHFWRHVSTLGILFQVSEMLVKYYRLTVHIWNTVKKYKFCVKAPGSELATSAQWSSLVLERHFWILINLFNSGIFGLKARHFLWLDAC